MAKVAAQLWEMQPVQTAVKSFGAGLAVVGLLWTSKKAFKLFGSNSLAGVELLRQSLGPEAQKALDAILVLDEDLAQIMARLEPFRRFSPEAYDAILHTSLAALETKKRAYRRVTASAAFAVRQAYQKVIEAVRLFRSRLDKHISHDIEDFDEIAAEFNSKVDQACLDIIQDHALL